MQKILFVSTSFPSQLGDMRRFWLNMSAFAKEFEVHFLQVKVDAGADRAKIGLPPGVKFTLVEPRRLAFDPLFFLLAPPSWKRALLIRAAAPQIQEYIGLHSIDAVIIHPIDTSFALRGLRARVKVAEFLDSIHSYYASKNRVRPTVPSLAMEWSQKAFTPLLQAVSARAYGLIVFVSVLDLPKGGVGEKCAALEARDPPIARKNAGRRKNDVIIIGTWGHPPNRDGLAKLLPEMGKIRGGVIIAGPHLRKQAYPPNVKFAGFVDDITRSLSDSKVCLIPTWYGVGLQNKVFDALRCGCTIVSTPFTRETFEANGFVSDAIIYSEDLVGATNRALAKWSPRKAAAAYASYGKFYGRISAQEKEYVARVKRLLENGQHPGA